MQRLGQSERRQDRQKVPLLWAAAFPELRPVREQGLGLKRFLRLGLPLPLLLPPSQPLAAMEATQPWTFRAPACETARARQREKVWERALAPPCSRPPRP